MQDFYILQRSQKILNAEQIQRWLLTVEMLLLWETMNQIVFY